ncbi:hypothetical protein XJ44_04010 [Thermosipho affectus]|uniref:DUF4932 domain-containing protein n=1 Tax=Thermosipho affectus TaxID=660294 RepID=A0ABX3IHQ1_9BACT|nr:hypothetical protein [Thermosipho affectus]ONN27361.1 hypothetical protein XJ44_04010 [Thermosipho affectus]
MKKVVATVEKGVNYIFHVFAASGVNFQNDYTKDYSCFLRKEDLEFLKMNREILSFQNGTASKLVDPLIFFPAYLNLDSEEKLQKYFYLLLKALKRRTKEDFLREYADYVKKRRFWFPEINDEWFKNIEDKAELIEKVGKIYKENFSSYESMVWPDVSRKLEEKAKVVNQELEKLDLIRSWEEVTGIDFKFGEYQIVLVFSIENGPNANSLGYDRNVFYSGSRLDWLLDFISHEVGTHILIDLGLPMIKKFISNDRLQTQAEVKQFQQFYMAYECLPQFYNTMVLAKELTYDLIQFKSDKYLRIYGELYDTGKYSAKEMLEIAMESLV